jgi:hypothetical protein
MEHKNRISSIDTSVPSVLHYLLKSIDFCPERLKSETPKEGEGRMTLHDYSPWQTFRPFFLIGQEGQAPTEILLKF